VDKIIGHKIVENNVSLVWCKVCTKHVHKIREGIRGKALNDLEKYIQGSGFVTKHTVFRHITKSDVHQKAVKLEWLESGDHACQGNRVSPQHLQPLDRFVFGPLRTYFEQEDFCLSKMKFSHVADMTNLFCGAYYKACAISNATASFGKSGICPYERNTCVLKYKNTEITYYRA
jgi:hypothetical protein